MDLLSRVRGGAKAPPAGHCERICCCFALSRAVRLLDIARGGTCTCSRSFGLPRAANYWREISSFGFAHVVLRCLGCSAAKRPSFEASGRRVGQAGLELSLVGRISLLRPFLASRCRRSTRAWSLEAVLRTASQVDTGTLRPYAPPGAWWRAVRRRAVFEVTAKNEDNRNAAQLRTRSWSHRSPVVSILPQPLRIEPTSMIDTPHSDSLVPTGTHDLLPIGRERR